MAFKNFGVIIMDETKKCLDCSEEKTLDMFYPKRAICKICQAKRRKEKAQEKIVNNIEETQSGDGIIETIEVKKQNKPKALKASKKDITSELQEIIIISTTLLSLPLGAHWQYSAEEAEAIARPLSRILEKHNLIKKVVEQSSYVLLASAIISTTTPRIMLSIQSKKKAVKKDDEGKIKKVDSGNSESTRTTENESNAQNIAKLDEMFIPSSPFGND
jgi:hypothetical protein